MMTRKLSVQISCLLVVSTLALFCSSFSDARAADLASMAIDDTGAIAAASIACNASAIKSGIKSLFSGMSGAATASNDSTTWSGSNGSAFSPNNPPTAPTNNIPAVGNTSVADLNGGDLTSSSIGPSGESATTLGSTSSAAGASSIAPGVAAGNATTSATAAVGGSSGAAAGAGNPVTDIGNTVANITNGGVLRKISSQLTQVNANTSATADATAKVAAKLTCMQKVERAAAQTLLKQITVSTVDWINHGFAGNPIYSKDTGSLLKGIWSQTVKDFTSIIGYDGKNYPFGKAFSQSLIRQLATPFESQAKFSLNRVIQERTAKFPGGALSSDAYYKDFAVGGWNAFVSQTFYNNNPIGFTMAANNEIANRTAGTSYSKAQDLKDALQRNGGFQDVKVCVAPTTYDPKTSPQKASIAQGQLQVALAAASQTPTNGTAAAGDTSGLSDSLGIGGGTTVLGGSSAISTGSNGSTSSAATIASLQQTIAANTCTKWETQTPGSTVQQMLNGTLQIPSNSLINGQDLSYDISAIMNALLSHFINEGLNKLSTTNPTSTATFQQFSGGTPASTDSSSPDLNGSWQSQGDNFNVFTDIPSVIRYEDNDPTDPVNGDPTLTEGYQQILTKEIATVQTLVPAIYQLDYCIPGPHPGWTDDSTYVLQSDLANDIPKSTDPATLQGYSDWMAKNGSTVSAITSAGGAVAGAIIGSAVPGVGTAIGAAVGALVGVIAQNLGTWIGDLNVDHRNEHVYSAILGTLLSYAGTPKVNIIIDANPQVNGYDHVTNILSTLYQRYATAVATVYSMSNIDYTNVGIDLINADNTEYQNIPKYSQAISDNQTLLVESQNTEAQLKALEARIAALPTLAGYPGLTGSLDGSSTTGTTSVTTPNSLNITGGLTYQSPSQLQQAAESQLSNSGIAVGTRTSSSYVQTPTVRDYKADFLAIQDVTDLSQLTDYEVELKKINDTFSVLAPNIHGADDLKTEEASLSAVQATLGNFAGKNGYIAECVRNVTDPKYKGPIGRIDYPASLQQYIPASLKAEIPPTISFLPDFYYHQWNDTAGQADFLQEHGFAADPAKSIENQDVVSVDRQDMPNSLAGLEYMLGMY